MSADLWLAEHSPVGVSSWLSGELVPAMIEIVDRQGGVHQNPTMPCQCSAPSAFHVMSIRHTVEGQLAGLG